MTITGPKNVDARHRLKVLPNYGWGDPRMNLSHLTPEMTAISLIADACSPGSNAKFDAQPFLLSRLCGVIRIDPALPNAPSYNVWTITLRSDFVETTATLLKVDSWSGMRRIVDAVKVPDQRISTCKAFVLETKAMLCRDEALVGDFNSLTSMAQRAVHGNELLMRRAEILCDRILPTVSEYWFHKAAVFRLQATRFSCPHNIYDVNRVLMKGIDIDLEKAARMAPPGTPMPITAAVIDHCTHQKAGDETTGLGFDITFRSKNPVLENTYIILSVRNPAIRAGAEFYRRTSPRPR